MHCLRKQTSSALRREINVNGKQYTVAAADVIHVADDASAPCKVAVQSFDMFNVTVTASCSEPKTH